MGSAARRQVKIPYVDQAQFIFVCTRRLAQSHLLRRRLRDKFDLYRTILLHDLIGKRLRLFHLGLGQRRRIQINRTCFLAHVKGNCRQVEQAHERGREHMLSGVLLHVIPPPRGINQASNARTPLRRLVGLDVVNHAAIFCFSDLHHAESFEISWGRNPSRVVHLSPAGRIKGRAVEIDSMPPVNFRGRHNFDNFPLKFVQKRVVIIKTICHRISPASRRLS